MNSVVVGGGVSNDYDYDDDIINTDTYYCFRGLEYRTPKGSMTRKICKLTAATAVFAEQERRRRQKQKQQKGKGGGGGGHQQTTTSTTREKEWRMIRESYQDYTTEPAIRAHRLALQDANDIYGSNVVKRAVEDDYDDGNTSFFGSGSDAEEDEEEDDGNEIDSNGILATSPSSSSTSSSSSSSHLPARDSLRLTKSGLSSLLPLVPVPPPAAGTPAVAVKAKQYQLVLPPQRQGRPSQVATLVSKQQQQLQGRRRSSSF